MNEPSSAQKAKISWVLALMLVCAVLVGTYSNARYGGFTSDGDTLSQVSAANDMLSTGRLDGPASYDNGFAYGALLAFTGQITGLSPYILVLWGGVWTAVFVLVAFMAYRELLGDPWLALFSTLLLFMFPDLMYYVLRGGHERVTWMLALLMIFLLSRSLQHTRQPWVLMMYIAAFYLVFWQMASTNVFFGSSFASAILLAFVGSRVFDFLRSLRWREKASREHLMSRLMLVSMICLGLVYVFINYTYQPALGYYYYLGDWVNKTSSLLFGAQEETGAPSSYVYFGSAWRATGVYLALVGPQFLLAGVSFLKWLVDLRKLTHFDDRRWFLWWLFAAFGGLLVFGIISDIAGFLQGNLQLRMFTPFTLLCAPMAALVLRDAYRFLARRQTRLAVLVGGLLLAYGLMANMVKITNDPLASNVWFFYAPAEKGVGLWMEDHIRGQLTWVDTWSRLSSLFRFGEDFPTEWRHQYIAGGTAEGVPYRLITENTLRSASRRGAVIPPVSGFHQVYDNGMAQLYFRRALTPYQK